ncbi:MAG: acyl-CoA thioesterase [Candidatus Sericytochromatia bacterium]|nr:acyl-CoA thioesterase [Candidatus Sericytochromatia bacterium]
MMTVRVRLAAMLSRWFLVERRQPEQSVSRLHMRCVLTDLDINRHMNNSRYLALMDVGRYHYTLVSGLWRPVWHRRWFPVLVRAEMNFKRSIGPGERFVLETSLVAIGNKSATLRQRFLVGDVIAAEGIVTALFLHKGKPQVLQSLIDELPALVPEPEPDPGPIFVSAN